MNANEFLATEAGFERTVYELDSYEHTYWTLPDKSNGHSALPDFQHDYNALFKWVLKDDWAIHFYYHGFCMITVGAVACMGKGKTRSEQAFAACLKVYGWDESTQDGGE